MHKFMSAIGFHNCISKSQLDSIIKDVLAHPDTMSISNDSIKGKLFQIKKYYADRIGFSVVGEINEMGFKNVQYGFPFVEGLLETYEDEIYLQKFADKDAYAGISEDYNIGVSLIYYVLSMVDLVQEDMTFLKETHNIRLSALSTEGKVIFGIEKNDYQKRVENEGKSCRNNLIQQAKNGDMDAIENLTLEDIDLYSIISKRALQEDIYSIVDTSFMPYGVESDQYTIIGNIEGIRKSRNKQTNELLYIMDIQCNDLDITVCINALDLIGEPEIGRRFKGNIWLQGTIIKPEK